MALSRRTTRPGAFDEVTVRALGGPVDLDESVLLTGHRPALTSSARAIIALIARSSCLARLNLYWYTIRRVRWALPVPLFRVISMTCPSTNALPLAFRCPACQCYGTFAAREPTMKLYPAFSNASRFAADSIPASATTMTSRTWWAAWKSVGTGIRALVVG